MTLADPASDVARRLRRDAKKYKHAERYWAGWRLELTFGPYEQAFDQERAAKAKAAAAKIFEQFHGKPAPSGPEADAASLESQRDLWHLSVSWRGSFPADDGRLALSELIESLGVPEDQRKGQQFARLYSPSGRPSPQVTHWIWKDEP